MTKHLFAQTIPDKVFGKKQKSVVKLDWEEKISYRFMRAFSLLWPKLNF